MVINPNTLLSLINLPPNLHPLMVTSRVQRYFCAANTINGKCNTCCTDCKDDFLQVFEKLQNSDANNAYAMLVWLLRDQAARKAETSHEATVKRNWLGEQIETNPFEELYETYT